MDGCGNRFANRKGESAVRPPGIYVITPKGILFGCIPILKDQVTNMIFSKRDKRTLYVTAGKTLFRISIRVTGWSVYP